jgi:hypothetical protein
MGYREIQQERMRDAARRQIARLADEQRAGHQQWLDCYSEEVKMQKHRAHIADVWPNRLHEFDKWAAEHYKLPPKYSKAKPGGVL